MNTMNNDTIINFLKDNPRSTAKEIGVTPVELSRLQAKGLVERVGSRSSGGRGRPSVEWALPGQVTPQEFAEQVDAPTVTPIPALARVSDELRAMMPMEVERQVTYIEAVFDGKKGMGRDAGEYKMLKDRHTDLVTYTKRVNGVKEATDKGLLALVTKV
jgi:hypothetical protein